MSLVKEHFGWQKVTSDFMEKQIWKIHSLKFRRCRQKFSHVREILLITP